MENQNALSLQRKLIIEHNASDGGTPTLVCRGRITMETANHFRSEIKTLAPKHKFLKADLGGIDFVDSDGLGSILGTYILALSHGCDLMLVNVNSRVKDLLNITHLEVVFENGRRTGLTEGARLRADGHPDTPARRDHGVPADQGRRPRG